MGKKTRSCFCCFRTNKNRDEEFDYVSYKPRNNNVTPPPPDLTKDNIPRTAIDELKSKLETKHIGDSESLTAMIPESQRGAPHPPAPPILSEDGLIIPRKLHNPVLDNAERQNLHRELLFNQKIGKNVLNQKSELQRALEKHKSNVAKKEYENNMNANTPELKKVIEDRARRQQEMAVTENEDDKGLSKEFLQARAKLKTRADVK